ncbi:PilT/PilU family type 4a pilus ATPase [Aeromonas diversa]|uniref:Twitching motility protein PilU n=1 Tax=Aeromonas diversa CDC 2478-85 TaxID=1268237 RepID=N9VLT0_9GAMM|nr:PilT/PilU family type 4a pilus ATPase [Aeromonas diversa]ENY72301.1 twitching motility protein PilU [Aeromonas diversa CDC 2478-85]
MSMDAWLSELVARRGSDLFVTTGMAPTVKQAGHLVALADGPLSAEGVTAAMTAIMDEETRRRFEQTREANFAIHRPGLGRFRVSAFLQLAQPGMVLRRIESRIPTFEDLKLPPVLKEVVMAKRGLILFVGATGAGKTTTQAAMIGYRNQHADGHILTVEDPVEFVHQHGRSIVTQREVGLDTVSFDAALRSSLRQAPDLILIGEIRSQETMEFALQFAETGHICMATLHANNADQAIERIMHLMPEGRQRQLRYDLAFNLKAIVAQQLLPLQQGEGRCAAFEILFNTPLIGDIIRKGEVDRLKEVMGRSRELGMVTFDQSLFDLYVAGQISMETALAHADSVNDLRLMIKLKGGEKLGSGSLDNVTLQPDMD